MLLDFEELDYQQTPLGDISLRRRAEPRLEGKIIYEVKLRDEFLMSSLFTEAEIQLSKLALAECEGKELDVVVGGLGLGYTAFTALENSFVRSLKVIDVMKPVIDWHRRGLVPLGKQLVSDPRCSLVHGDFFAIASSSEGGFEHDELPSHVHAVLLDIDHSPTHWLNPGNGDFYTVDGLRNLSDKLLPAGIFGLWSDDPPDMKFIDLLNSVFESSTAHLVTFPNPYTGGESSNTVYLSHKRKT